MIAGRPRQTARDEDGSNKTRRLVLLAVGALFVAENFYFLRFDVWRWWPLAIVVFGLFVVSKAYLIRSGRSVGSAGPSRSIRSGRSIGFGRSVGPSGQAGAVRFGRVRFRRAAKLRGGRTTDQKISEFAVWSGVQRRVTSPAFKRADLTAVMGGIEFDLRQAGTDNGEAVIEVFVHVGRDRDLSCRRIGPCRTR